MRRREFITLLAARLPHGRSPKENEARAETCGPHSTIERVPPL